MIEIRWDWIAGHLDDVAEKTWQHLQLLVIPMLAGFVIALGLAVLAAIVRNVQVRNVEAGRREG